MVKHIVMWTLAESAVGKEKEENLEEVRKRLQELTASIDDIQSLEVGVNFNTTEDAYDIVLVTEFQDKEALARYQDHPEHIKVRDFLRKVRVKHTVVDYCMEKIKDIG
jgi:heme-degrading monooxygenase HmoA